jgi:hypothetical protein
MSALKCLRGGLTKLFVAARLLYVGGGGVLFKKHRICPLFDKSHSAERVPSLERQPVIPLKSHDERLRGD